MSAAGGGTGSSKKPLEPYPDHYSDEDDGDVGSTGDSTTADAVATTKVSCEIISMDRDTVQIRPGTTGVATGPPKNLPFSALLADIDIAALAATPPLSDDAFDASRRAGGSGSSGGGARPPGGLPDLDIVGMNNSSSNDSKLSASTKPTATATATNAAAAAPPPKATLPRLHHFQWKFMDETAVYAQVIELGGGSRWIWIGSGDAKFSNLNLALVTPNSIADSNGAAKIPPVTSFIGKSIGFSQALTQRLAVVSGSPVYVSYNLPAHNPLLEAFVQKKLTDALKSLGGSTTTAAAAASAGRSGGADSKSPAPVATAAAASAAAGTDSKTAKK